ncbi:hypothetical protein T8K17_23455 [Thalassobaculum sp. OXR-137]|uniref:hypothetical protein n=1 Tax=Thalassobaculum sp. OXR-137 TaxID=3100173 RepID=UPI002AC9B556|nr:hypothetical protein [Thalassobaculum sp. OXR-137]WPZ34176.1 hypothetical protein T8K17_23455 [Thalassobaculum sp. OXR-137]
MAPRDPIAQQALRRGLAERAAQRAADAQAWFQAAICAAPDDFRVVTLAIGGDARSQAKWCGRALCIDPQQPQVLELAGQALAEIGAGTRSVAFLRRALLADPAGPRRAAFAMADHLARSGRIAAAVPFAWWAAISDPSQPIAQVRLATIAGQTERWTMAADAALRASRLLPLVTGLSVTAVLAARRLRRNREAWDAARRAAIAAPDSADAIFLLSEEADRPVGMASARRWARRAVLLSPLSPKAWEHQAMADRGEGDFAASFASGRRGLLAAPHDLGSTWAIGQAAILLARFDLAGRVAHTGLMAYPGDSELSYLWSQVEKVVGDLGRGWDLEASRAAGPRFHRTVGLPPRVAGPDLPKEGLLVAAEQGIGDELLFLSCLPDLLAECPTAVVEVDPRLRPLFARSFPGLRLIDRQVRAEGLRAVYDYRKIVPALGLTAHLHAGDLPGRYLRDRSRPSECRGYLTADPARVAGWRERLAGLEGEGPVIGLCWRSMLRSGVRAAHYAELPQMLPILRMPGYRFVSLQYDESGAELDALRRDHGIALWRPDDLDQMEDLDGVAALISALDGVVSTATSVCAMAPAVGCPTIRLGASFYGILDDRDLFFSNMTPTLRGDEVMNISRAIDRAVELLRARR